MKSSYSMLFGLAALGMAAVQMLIIPRLRRRLLVLGRQRQIAARQLAGRVTEIVEGIEAIHANDTSNYERADISSRLGNLFRIRYEIYQRKYKVKFLNNFISQLTPFLFYLVGGYLAITGSLDVGQLVAVVTAYKELPGPLRELIDWDLAKQDVQVKYEQIVDQFDVEPMILPEFQIVERSTHTKLGTPLSASNLWMEDESGSVTLDNVSVTIDAGQAVAVLGDAYSGANILAEAFGGITRPVRGKVTAGKDNLAMLPESITGRRITYASADAYFFSGSIEENLLYGLKHSPLDDVDYSGKDATLRNWELQEARRTGNPEFDPMSNWIDSSTVNGYSESDGILAPIKQVLAVTRLLDDVFDFALHSKLDLRDNEALDNSVIALRAKVRDELQKEGLSGLIIPFQIDQYNPQANVLDNIIFGILTNPATGDHAEEATTYLRNTMRKTGLDEVLVKMGLAIAESSRELFQDLADDHPFFDRLAFMEPEEITRYRLLYQRTRNRDFADMSIDDRFAWIELSYLYTEPQYRFGLLDDGVMQKVVETRKLLHQHVPENLKPLLDIYDPEHYLASANLIDNIVFGKVDHRFKDAERQIHGIIESLLRKQPELYNALLSVGLEFNVGSAGRRLSAAQRQKFNLARALLRRSDYYIFNRPVSGLDQVQQERIINNTLYFLSRQADSPGIVWVLALRANARYFDRRITFHDKIIIEDKMLETFQVVPDTLITEMF